MKLTGNIRVLFVTGFGPIVSDRKASQELYLDALGLPFKRQDGDYLYLDAIDGVKHFALWPLSMAAQSCFGVETWPGDTPVPHAWIEFDVEDLEQATAELRSRGYRLLVADKKEPWGQMVTRFLSPEGLLVALAITPALREKR